jgi:hypothetical protein
MRVIPTTANFRSLCGNFGAWGTTKLLKIWDQSLEEPMSDDETLKIQMTILRLNALHSSDETIRIEPLHIYGHNKQDKFGEKIRKLFGLIRLQT